LKSESRKIYGFVAQDVKKTHPELALKKSDSTLGIDYVDIISVLMMKVQDLQNQIDNLK
jgi:hypothetical protein